MSKSKLLTFAVIALIVINIITLSFFIFKGPKDRGFPGPRQSPKDVVVNKLHFDDNQVIKYDELIKQHSESISKIDNKIVMLKNKLYVELSKSDNDLVVENLFQQIATNQTEIEKLHYNHFLDVKKLCKPDQLNDYRALTIELAELFSPKMPPNNRNGEQHP